MNTQTKRMLALLLACLLTGGYATAAHTIPGRIEAEAFDDAFDTTPGNSGDALSIGDIDIQSTSDVGGGYNIGWIEQGEYLRYDLSAAHNARYRFRVRVASSTDRGAFHFKLNGENVGTVLNVPDTGGWQRWADLSASLDIPAGNHQLEVYMEGGLFNLNYLDVTEEYRYIAIPARIEAEDFHAAFDTTVGNAGDAPPRGFVDLETCDDVGVGNQPKYEP